MKELKINKAIEAEVEVMFILGKQLSEIQKAYPACWNILKYQFALNDSFHKKNPDSVDNLKIRLYAEIVRKKESDKLDRKKEEEEKLKKINRNLK